jgi:phosphoribosylformylglycinamidine synthase PurS subunit
MPKIIVNVMLKEEILDPQGAAVAAAMARLGFSFAKSVRQGKRFEITCEQTPTQEDLDSAKAAASGLLANLVIEDFTITVEG